MKGWPPSKIDGFCAPIYSQKLHPLIEFWLTMHLPRCLWNGAACRSRSQATRRKGRRASGMPTTRQIIDAGLTMDADTRCLRGWMNTRPGWLTW
jgi:hypothetical protein